MAVIDPYTHVGDEDTQIDMYADADASFDYADMHARALAAWARMGAAKTINELLALIREYKEWNPDLHPRGEGGRFAPVGSDFAETVRNEGGFTYKPIGRHYVHKGIAFSPYPEHEKIIDAKHLHEQDIRDYQSEHADLLSKVDHYLGAWHNKENGKVYLDVSVVRPESDRSRIAEFLAKYNQLAAYDLSKGEEITAESKRRVARLNMTLHLASHPGPLTDSEITELVAAIQNDTLESKVFDESQHPRDAAGRFAEGSGGDSGDSGDTGGSTGVREAPAKRTYWKAQKTLEAVQYEIHELYPHVLCNLEGLNITNANDVARGLHSVMQRYPEAAKSLRVIWSTNDPEDSSYAWVRQNEDGSSSMMLNTKLFKDRAALLNSLDVSDRSGWHAPGTNTVQGVMAHEFGHVYDNWIHSSKTSDAWFKYTAGEGYGHVRSVFDTWRADNRDAQNAVSRYVEHAREYGSTSAKEAFAEAFAQHECTSRDRWGPYTERVDELLKVLGPSEAWTRGSEA